MIRQGSRSQDHLADTNPKILVIFSYQFIFFFILDLMQNLMGNSNFQVWMQMEDWKVDFFIIFYKMHENGCLLLYHKYDLQHNHAQNTSEPHQYSKYQHKVKIPCRGLLSVLLKSCIKWERWVSEARSSHVNIMQ